GHSVLTHGELYPAHTLVEDERITAVLDWTTAAVGDPAKDLMFHQVSAPSEIFEVALQAYAEGGGRPWPGLARHCTEMFSAAPLAGRRAAPDPAAVMSHPSSRPCLHVPSLLVTAPVRRSARAIPAERDGQISVIPAKNACVRGEGCPYRGRRSTPREPRPCER